MTRKKIFVILAPFLLMAGCRNQNSEEKYDKPIPVITCSPVTLSIAQDIRASGNAEGFRIVKIGFMVAGRINYISAGEGDRVSTTKPVASLDPASYEIAKELAGIQLDQTQDEYDRLKIMHDNKSLSESDFSKISFGLQQAKAQFRLHSRNLDETKLFSPINGVVVKKLAEVGEITGVGIPVMVVSDINKIKINVFVPETEIFDVRIGQTAEVFISSLDKTVEGRVIETGAYADPASRAFSVRIEIENPGLIIRPGMIAEVKIHTGKKKEITTLPVEALLRDLNGVSYVFAVDTIKMKAFRKDIITGEISNDQAEVISGIEMNDIIVKGGSQKLVDGSSVSFYK
ncbi:MAG: efflux RND transporter periplasmic adaptor subunit [Bacteroidales bacterium]|nr:efflux RND transporter periplasmic adaptor subunit [Bacteroidales bacterium]